MHLAVKKYLMLKQIAEKKKHYTFGKRTQVEHDMVLIKDIITYLLTFKIDMCVCDEVRLRGFCGLIIKIMELSCPVPSILCYILTYYSIFVCNRQTKL